MLKKECSVLYQLHILYIETRQDAYDTSLSDCNPQSLHDFKQSISPPAMASAAAALIGSLVL